MTDESPMPQARIERRDTRSYHVQGAMTFDSVTNLLRQSEDMFSDDGLIRIDLAEVTRTDSGGLALLIEWLPRQKCRISQSSGSITRARGRGQPQ